MCLKPPPAAFETSADVVVIGAGAAGGAGGARGGRRGQAD
jgi:hypothetical protein